MKVKVTNKVKGEMVIACLGGSLKKNDVLTLDHGKSSHQDVLWAIHHGYLEVIDSSIQNPIQGDLVCFVNCGKRTLTGRMFVKPLDPSRSIVVHKNDPIFSDLMKMVDSGKLCVSEPPKKDALVVEKESVVSGVAKPIDSKQKDMKEDSRKSFKKKPAGKKEEKSKVVDDIMKPVEEKSNLNAKTSNRITTVVGDDPVFVDMNGEVS